MKHKFRDLPLQVKMVLISLTTNILVLIVNVVLLLGINTMSERLDSVYQSNLFLNEMSDALDGVQAGTTEYLNTKTSDALEEYYRSVSEYTEYYTRLGEEITGSSFERMERTIRKMSERYLAETDLTIDGKRGRNVEKYRVHYEEASNLYDYLRTYIYSLNNEQFMENSVNYNEMLGAFRRFQTISTMVMVVVILGNIALVLQLTFTMIQPLRALQQKADEVTKGNFDIEPLPVNSRDEIGVVTSAFNKMVVSIRQYIDQVKKSMETEQELREKELMITTHLKDAQLKYLQAQINPHFLFNTLNAGAQLAMMEGADRTYEYVQHMADFFRYTVRKGHQTVTVRDEIELVDNYIYILNVRFSGDIHYDKEIDQSLLDVEMPGMILQPIVENCVNHGIREMMGEGRITLKVYGIDDVACINIADNGVGMSEEQIEDILAGTVNSVTSRVSANSGHETKGIGLDNVIARLKLFTQTDDPLAIESEGEGTGSSFTIYLERKERQGDV